MNISCSEFEVNNWIISDFILERLIPLVHTKPFPLSELQLMTAAVCRFKPQYIFDWGTHVGKSARIFYEICDNFHIQAHLYSIDLPDDEEHIEHPHEKRGLLVRKIKTVALLQGDGVTEAVKIAKKHNDNIHLFLLDGDHEYKTVKRELDAIERSIKHPIILIHDTFYQSEQSGYNIGPYQAIQEFCKKHSSYKALNTNTGLPGLTLLYKQL